MPKMLYFLLAGGMVIPLADRVAEVLPHSQLTPHLQLQVRGTKNVTQRGGGGARLQPVCAQGSMML